MAPKVVEAPPKDLALPAEQRIAGLEKAIARQNKEIARLKEAEHSLNQMRAWYQAFLRAQSEIGEGFAIVDGKTQRFLYVNDGICKISGYTAEELLAKPSIFEQVVPEERGPLIRLLGQRVNGEDGPGRVEVAILRKDGERAYVDVAVRWLEPDAVTIIAIIRDITERRLAEEALRREAL